MINILKAQVTDVGSPSIYATIVRQKALHGKNDDRLATYTAEKGRWIEPAALKHGSAVGRPLPEVAFMP